MCRKNVWRRDTEKWRLMPVLQLVRQIRFMWGISIGTSVITNGDSRSYRIRKL